MMKELDREGVADNTCVLFLSDNGRPFPRDKTTLYDSGIKTPFIVRFPGKVRAGRTARMPKSYTGRCQRSKPRLWSC